MPELAGKIPALAEECMRGKGLQYKSSWAAWSPTEFILDGANYTFDVKKLGEGLILAGGECGPMDVTIIVGNDNFIRAKLKKKAMKIRGSGRAHHVERLAFRVLKDTARSRAQSFLKVFFAGIDRRGKPHSRRRSENG